MECNEYIVTLKGIIYMSVILQHISTEKSRDTEYARELSD